MKPIHVSRIKNWQQEYVKTRKFPGSSLLIKQGGRELLFTAVGLRNVEANLPYTRDTVVRLYSMTKPITSAAILILVERGLVELEAPISNFVPEFSQVKTLVPDAISVENTAQSNPPTVLHLLTHTGGFSYPFNAGVLPSAMAQEDLVFGPGDTNLSDTVSHSASYPLAFHPGKRWEYSIGIDILGHVIEVVSKQSLADFFTTEIFKPLGMSETAFRLPSNVGTRFASLYSPQEGAVKSLVSAKPSDDTLRLIDEYRTSPFRDTKMMSGGGGLVGTIDDYIKFCEMLRLGGTIDNQTILTTETVDFMMSNQLDGDIASMGPTSFAEQPMEGMGFGIGGAVLLDPERAQTAGSVGDFSWGGMASTFFWIDRKNDLSAVFFTQLSPSSSYPARAELKTLVQRAILDL